MRLQTVIAFSVVLLVPVAAAAQDRGWAAEVGIGWAGLVDDATKNYRLAGGTVRRHMSPRVSIGPELVIMSNPDSLRDRNVMLTGNVVFDAAPGTRISAFAIAGAGMFWGRERLRDGPYWSNDPAFTAGGGLRSNVTKSVTVGVEYRVGWELHQRVSAFAGVRW
jgi:opacity protein-like surface antigen